MVLKAAVLSSRGNKSVRIDFEAYRVDWMSVFGTEQIRCGVLTREQVGCFPDLSGLRERV